MEVKFNKKEKELLEQVGAGIEFQLYWSDNRRILNDITGKKLGKQDGFTQIKVLKLIVPGFHREQYRDYVKSKPYYFNVKSTEKALKEILEELEKRRTLK